MAKVKLAAVNMNVELRNPEANLKKIINFIQEAGENHINFLVFPEMCYQGFFQPAPIMTELAVKQKKYYRKTSQPIPGQLTTILQTYAKKYNMFIQVGLSESALHGEVIYNSVAIIGPTGVEGVFRKLHNQFEFPFFNPGNNIPVIRLPWGTVGPFICYDLAFPEVTRIQALKGADILALSTAWPMISRNPESDHHGYCYDIMCRANAIFNQVWLISSNHSEKREDVWYYGHSMIIAPNGAVVAEIKGEEGLVIAEVDIYEEIIKARTETFTGLNILQDRRPELYKIIVDTDIYYRNGNEDGLTIKLEDNKNMQCIANENIYKAPNE